MSTPIMGPVPRRLAALLAAPALLLAVVAAGLAFRAPAAPARLPEAPPAPPRIIRAYQGPADELSVERLQGLDDRQRAAARQAVEDARRRLGRNR